MTRLPVIFYFTARPRRRKTCGEKGEEAKLLGSACEKCVEEEEDDVSHHLGVVEEEDGGDEGEEGRAQKAVDPKQLRLLNKALILICCSC